MLLHDQMNDAVADVHMDPERASRPAPRAPGADGSAGTAGSGRRSVGSQPPESSRSGWPSRFRGTTPLPRPRSRTTRAIRRPLHGRRPAGADRRPQHRRRAPRRGSRGRRRRHDGLRRAEWLPHRRNRTPRREDPAHLEDTYGEFELTPASGGGPGVVGVNVQHCVRPRRLPVQLHLRVDDRLRDPPAPGRRPGAHLHGRAGADGRGRRAAGSGGHLLPGATSGWSRRRPTASSCRERDEWDVTRPEPVLSSDQLADVVSQDWWGFKLPARFAEEGKELNPYEEIEGSL